MNIKLLYSVVGGGGVRNTENSAQPIDVDVSPYLISFTSMTASRASPTKATT